MLPPKKEFVKGPTMSACTSLPACVGAYCESPCGVRDEFASAHMAHVICVADATCSGASDERVPSRRILSSDTCRRRCSVAATSSAGSE